MSSLVKNRYQAASFVWMTSRKVPSLNAWLPMNTIRDTSVSGPSLISNTRSTRFCSSSITLGSTVAAKRPLRR